MSKVATHLDRRWPARVVSINWGPWEKRGMVSEELLRQFERRGITLIPSPVGRRRLVDEIRYGRKGESEVIVAGRSGDTRDLVDRDTPSWPLLEVATPRVKSGLVEVAYTLDPARDLLLDDHRLDGSSVLPAAEAIELMAEVAKHGWPRLEVVRLSDIRVQRGIVLGEGPREVRIVARADTARPVEDGNLAVEVRLTDISASRRPYYRATVELAERLPPAPRYEAAYATPLKSFPETVEQAYSKYLFHGPMLQCIDEIEGINEEGIVGRVTPSSPERSLTWEPQGEWLIDPVVIDSGFQLAIVWARMVHDFTPLPSSFEVYHRYGSLSQSPIWCYLHSQADPNSLTMRTQLFFVASDGHIVGAFEGAESTCSRALNRMTGLGRLGGGT
jgi:hypothetical protein